MKKVKPITCILLAIILICGLFFSGIALADTFNKNNIINDVVFDNTNTMSASLIDNWLNANFGSSSCISTSHGFSAQDPTGYSPSGGFSFGGNVSAGQVIFDAAQAYGLNPQVLLVTLQKEQSLVSGSAGCNTLAYSAAVGYGCPDGGTTYSYSGVNLYTINGTTVTSVSGTCVNSPLKAGFSQQIIRAAWLLKFGEQRSEGNTNWAVIKGSWDNSDDLQTCYGGPMTQGTWHRCPNDTATYYDGYTTIDNTAVHMDDGATAALYWYTPHFPGNQNFFNIFNAWFGSPYVSSITYSWSIVSQEAYSDSARTQGFTDGVSITPGQTAYLRIKTRNFGYKPWDQSIVRLGTTHGLNRSSVFANNTWLSSSRIEMLETSVLPGGVATFEFSITAPQQTGSYYEYFDLVADGITWFNDFGLNYPIDVVTTRQPTNSSNTGLQPGQSLSVNQYLLSPDTQSTLNLQSDGNLVLYSDFKPVWTSSSFDKTVASLIMQTDGNLVEYNAAGKALWNSGTPGNPGAYLTLQTDGNLVIRSSSNVRLWATNTISIPDHLNSVNKYLDNGRVLYVGQSLQTASGNYTLVLQSDGNLVLYTAQGKAVWNSQTTGSSASHLVMQTDGNLVLYTAQGKAVWNSQTNGMGASTLWMQSDGNLVTYNARIPTWASGTPGAK